MFRKPAVHCEECVSERAVSSISIQRIAQLLYLMIPVYLANMAPPFTRYWHGWNPSISRKHLGSHKTVLGFSLGILTAMAVAFLQSVFRWSLAIVPYGHWALVGLLAGGGAMAGDSVKSFFKRRLNIPPGHRWVPMDQLDFVVGGLFGLSFVVSLNWTDILCIMALSFIGDIAVNHIAFHAGIRDTKW